MDDPDKLMQRVGRRVAELRQRNGKTQEQLAQELDVGWRYLSRIERGLENLTLKALAELAEVLRVPVKDLFEDPNPELVIKTGRPKKTSPPA